MLSTEGMDATLKKANGVHYTPPKVAQFLAFQTALCLPKRLPKQLSLLDPACGDGELLLAMANQIRKKHPKSPLQIVGFELDREAVEQTKNRLSNLANAQVVIRNHDFLNSDCQNLFDVVISNPPYVRTQVMGGAESRRLSKKYKLTGRVDLYHAFTVAIHAALRDGGSLGLLTSNRFLTIKSGAAMRRLLVDRFELRNVFDLGDTKLFEAAVLPVIVTGNKNYARGSANDGNVSAKSTQAVPAFCRVYNELDESNSKASSSDLIGLLQQTRSSGTYRARDGCFRIDRGTLQSFDDGPWMLANSKSDRWLKTIRRNQFCKFDMLCEIKVGIKTTADSVFIREVWSELGRQSPEGELIHPLITHHDANRWRVAKGESIRKSVLYPYQVNANNRIPIVLSKFPRARAYLQSNRQRLEGRDYVINAGRKWYEIWVPHQPRDWGKPKIVWPDISEQPKFFFDQTGAIVNGDCYWIKLKPDVDPDWLYLMLGVANSDVATRFYDTVFHNKLYAGRRRFMTQYVKEFPLPDLKSRLGKRIVSWVKKQVEKPTEAREAKIEGLVQEAFGF